MIPKGAEDAAESLDACRNISCTSIFSKLLEAFMLDDIQSEVTLEENQYGGQKGCGTEHLLAEMVTETTSALDDNCAADSIISLDFRKAFNKMDHTICLRSLAAGGASNQTIRLVRSFLSDRRMKVKLGEHFSKEHLVPGEYPTVAFHPGLSGEASDSLERLQSASLRSIFGHHTSYSDCLRRSGLPTLRERRDSLLADFAGRAAASEHFSSS